MISLPTERLPAGGQEAYVVGADLGQEGWIRVRSDQTLAGLCFFGKAGSGGYMADITLIPNLSKTLTVPHVAQNSQWDTSVMICNPNSVATEITLTLVDVDGDAFPPQTHSLPPNGSGKYDLADLLRGTDGAEHVRSVEISASRGVAAFALYHDLKWDDGKSFAGISAVSPALLGWVPFGEAKPDTPVEIDTPVSTMYELIVDFDIPGMNVAEIAQEGGTYHFLDIPGGGHVTEVGKPQFPTVNRYIAIPAGATVSMEIADSASKEIKGYNIYPAQEALPDIADAPIPPFEKDAELYQEDKFYPAEIVGMEGPQSIRGCTVMILQAYPVQFNPIRKTLRVYSNIRVKLTFGCFGDDPTFDDWQAEMAACRREADETGELPE